MEKGVAAGFSSGCWEKGTRYIRGEHITRRAAAKSIIEKANSTGDDGQRERERGSFCIHRRGGQPNSVPLFRPCDKFASVDAGIEFPVA